MMAKVILIEDDRTMLSLLNVLLSMEGFQILLPASQSLNKGEILKQIRSECPDLALVDVNLRTFNGLDLLDEVRTDPEIKSMRVLMSSGIDVTEKCLAHGADGFILKPYMPDTLIQKIKHLLA